jgi:hypothetical protein
MKFKALILATLFALLGFASKASAQGCSSVMVPNYSDYVDFGASSQSSASSTYLTHTLVLDGYGTLDTAMEEYCPGIQAALASGSVKHSAQVHTKNLTTGQDLGWHGGTPGSPTAYLTETFTGGYTALDLGDPGEQFNIQYDFNIACTFGANIFSFSLSKYEEFAFTVDSRRGVPLPLGDGMYLYRVVHQCDNGTPDWNPQIIEDGSPTAPYNIYWVTGSFMVRISTKAQWTSITAPFGQYGITLAGYEEWRGLQECTHTGPQN